MASLTIDDTLLVAFADGELDALTTHLVAEQIAQDPALAARADAFRHSAELLRQALSSPEQLAVPALLAARVIRLTHARPAFSRRIGTRSWGGIAAAAAVAGFIFGAANIVKLPASPANAQHAAVEHILDEIADYHGVFAAETEHLVEVPASRRAHLESWLGSRVEYAFKVPDLKSFDLHFEGGRLLAVDRKPVAQLIYTGPDGKPVALCIALTDGHLGADMVQKDDGDLTMFGRGEGKHAFVVVGPASNRNLGTLARTLPELLARG